MVPIALMVFNRPDLTQKVIDQLALCKPHALYVIADGPRFADESPACVKTLDIALNPPWECDVVPFLRKENVGMVRQFKEGLDFVFQRHDSLIFMEDDHLISPSAYNYASELLDKYANNNLISHINFSNLFPQQSRNYPFSYFLSTHFSVWGFATWKRVWNSYDISMPSWPKCNQQKILNQYTHNRRERVGMKEMFDLHANNSDPWTYDYQWEFNCMNQEGFALTPKINLCKNIGFERDDATHNKGKNPFLNDYAKLNFPLNHPDELILNKQFDLSLSNYKCPSKSDRVISYLKRLICKMQKYL